MKKQFKTTNWVIPSRKEIEGKKYLVLGTANWFVTEDAEVTIEYRNHEGELIKTKVVKQYTKGGHTGKPYICLSTQEYVHRVVATAFIPNPENKRTVNHKDMNPFNNHVSNLEWATYSENRRHAVERKKMENKN